MLSSEFILFTVILSTLNVLEMNSKTCIYFILLLSLNKSHDGSGTRTGKISLNKSFQIFIVATQPPFAKETRVGLW